eukprot:1137480-Pelagomonas_calceolata.AAC.3
MAGASGHLCLTPASHRHCGEVNPFTTAAARVLLKRVRAHPTMPADFALWPSPAVPSHWGCPMGALGWAPADDEGVETPRGFAAVVQLEQG